VSAEIFNLVLYGGGRWARVIADVLSQVMPGNGHVFWVSHHHHPALLQWVQEKGHKEDITLFQDDAELWQKKRMNAAIVATAPQTHAVYAEKLIDNAIPVLVEKPFVLDFAQALRLHQKAQRKQVFCGVDLVFLYAGYLQDFAAQVRSSGTAVNRVGIKWHDPESECRYGEEKRPDFYTSIIHDMFAHIWSVLKIIFPDLVLRFDDVLYTPEETRILAQYEMTAIEISLSRRKKQRCRHISINDGQWQLDFTKEPGFIWHEGTKKENVWDQNKTPLYQVLTEFLSVVQGETPFSAWRLSLEKVLETVMLADQLDTALQASQYQYLRKIAMRDNPNSPGFAARHADILIDLFLPQCTAQGQRPAMKTREQQKAFAEYALSLYD